MKATLIIIVCCVAVTLAHDDRAQFKKYARECKQELNISVDEIQKPDSAQFGCVMKCILQKRGDMRADGTVDIERLVAYGPKEHQAEGRQILVGIYEGCLKQAKGDSCALAKCMSEHVEFF